MYFVISKSSNNSSIDSSIDHTNDAILAGTLIRYIIDLQWNVNGLVNSSFWTNKHMKSYKKCKAMCEIVQEADQRKPVPLNSNNQQWISQGHIEFSNFSARYRPDTEIVLDSINLNIKSGSKIGIVGRTGAGKSTLGLVL